MPKKSRSAKGRRRVNRRKSTKNMLKIGGMNPFGQLSPVYHSTRGQKCNGMCGYYANGIHNGEDFPHVFPNGKNGTCSTCGCIKK
jgi:hypothetical protein